ncbi:MAG: M20/M25/M40 family metallo-hydrolase [Clostridia bacterium]|nr:M20/M25/M40 family metallo-hydrolase [Clostridia bacterium]
MFKDMLKTMLAAYGATGREQNVSNVIRSFVEPYADEIYNDVMGNLIAVRTGESGKKIMLSAHMDQIGFIVIDIDEKGFLRVSNVGGINPFISVARAVVFESGVQGVLFCEPEKGMKEASMSTLFIDIGAKDYEEAASKVSIGDVAVYVSNYMELGDRVSCGALDDRICCAIVAEAFMNAPRIHDVYAVFTVQEEVGLRGATTAAYAINPDFGINLDVTAVGDIPKCAKMSVKLGNGPTIKVMDSSAIIPKFVRNHLERVACENNITVQNEVLAAGGTDAGAVLKTRGGIPACCISIPTRYIHTPVETADMRDCLGAIDFVRALLSEKEIPAFKA